MNDTAKFKKGDKLILKGGNAYDFLFIVKKVKQQEEYYEYTLDTYIKNKLFKKNTIEDSEYFDETVELYSKLSEILE